MKQLLTSNKVKRIPIAWSILVLSLLLTTGIITLAASFVAAQDRGRQEERTLEPDKPIEGELRGGSHHSYSVVLSAGQYLHVMVQQRGVDLVVTLRPNRSNAERNGRSARLTFNTNFENTPMSQPIRQ
jgi:hypothetical protein